MCVQVKLSVFLAYLRSVGVGITLVILLLYTLNTAASVAANFWLSFWSNDVAIDGAQDTKQRDLRLGVYGALGLAQGKSLLGGIEGGCGERWGLIRGHAKGLALVYGIDRWEVLIKRR